LPLPNSPALSLCLLLAVSISNNVHAASNQCTPVKNGNGIITFGTTKIKMIDYQIPARWDTSMAAVRSFCEKDCQANPGTQVWRIPSRADMAVIGKCLDPKATYWTSERVGEALPLSSYVGKHMMVYGYRDGSIVEENGWAGGIPYAGIAITGGAASELGDFARIADPVIAEMNEKDRTTKSFMNTSDTAKFYHERMRTEMGADAARTERIARQAALLGNPAKGTLWNCLTPVVPVNTSINKAGFSCPNGAQMDLALMQKYKWKITSTERIRAQAEDYRSDAYGMSNWDGSGVIISLMLEKQ
jgi:hypothetical protein